ncbi:BnaC06g15140D [Brassica napus]|uniref:BnaC06g15140D protein n=1 Tax=Brassica napus TaxID=3708 RepID=A0A078EZP9_BRANA|nr:BnaC06g15140D [Brassica napus]
MQIKTGITITEDGRLGLEEFSETSTYTSAPIIRRRKLQKHMTWLRLNIEVQTLLPILTLVITSTG